MRDIFSQNELGPSFLWKLMECLHIVVKVEYIYDNVGNSFSLAKSILSCERVWFKCYVMNLLLSTE